MSKRLKKLLLWVGPSAGVVVALVASTGGCVVPRALNPVAAFQQVETRLVIVGDAGAPALPVDPVLEAVRKEAARDPEHTVVLFLGAWHVDAAPLTLAEALRLAQQRSRQLPAQDASAAAARQSAVAAGQRRAQAVYANELKVTLSESFGQVQVRHAKDDRPLGKVYVKVYAEVNGRATFYKDGYTDLRGTFDYASLSTDDLGQVTRFGLLVLSPEHGAVVKEAKPPRQ